MDHETTVPPTADAEIDLDHPAVKAAIEAAVADLKQTNSELQARLDEKSEDPAQTARIADLESQLSEMQAKLSEAVIGGLVRDAAGLSGLVPSAVEDAIARAAGLFTVDTDGKAVRRDDGTPADLSTWLEGMREAAPHWWPASSGGGASGSGSGAGLPLTLTPEQARDPALYRRARAESSQSGRPFTIVG
ncbi:MAG: hypothetical protein NXI16_09300 [Alphaproteobacteria bacterium]|nr:hypothetical protein [Alphaproteobacteria bacterium]